MTSRVSPDRFYLALFLISPLWLFFSVASGAEWITFSQCLEIITGPENPDLATDRLILFSIRAPRVALTVCVGAILAICGAALQGLFRNPLADPSLIGVTAGCSAGASIIIVVTKDLGFDNMQTLPLVGLGSAFGGFAAVLLVYRLATKNGQTSVPTMLLAGIAVSAVAAATNTLLSYFSNNDMLRRMSLWHMGSVEGANWSHVLIAIIISLFISVVLRQGSALNALALGESEARHLGVDVEKLKKKLIVLTALGVGFAVAVAGVIAFVGLIVPHMFRLILGPDHNHLLPASALTGGVLLSLADVFSRTLIAPAELPIGVLTTLLGAPIFFYILTRNNSTF